MRKVFIADAHLKKKRDTNYLKLMEFLAELHGNTETLFILGDLFEFWLGYPVTPFTQYQPILEQLRLLTKHGTQIVYLEGNHDFHMGPIFTDDLRAQVHPGPTEILLNGTRSYLCHGDQINRADYGYLLLRRFLHSRLVASVFPYVPPSVVAGIAERLSHSSQKQHHQRRQRWDYHAILRQFAAERFQEGFQAVITGHFHLPLLEENVDGNILLSLGDWQSHFTYGEWREGRLTLKYYGNET